MPRDSQVNKVISSPVIGRHYFGSVVVMLPLLLVLLVASLLCHSHASRRVVVDVDAGADDAVALLMTLLAPGVEVLGVTCVRGNTDVDHVVVNVLKTLQAVDRLHVPVFPGAWSALLRNEPLSYHFGRDGFGDFEEPLRSNGTLREEQAAVALVRLAREEKGRLELLCLGPLTNVALAARLDRDFLSRLRRIAVMGGAAQGLGNVSPGVEFNFRMDPEAASVLLDNSPTPVLLIPWDTVVRTNISMEWRVSVLGKRQNPAVMLLNKVERRRLSTQRQWTSADSVAAAALLQPALVARSRVYHADVETQGTHARGALFVDYRDRLGGPPNVELVEAVDVDAFQRFLLESFPATSSDFIL